MLSDQDTVFVVITFIVWLLAIPATMKAIKRKGRSPGWVLLTVIFVPLFFIVELLPDKSNKEVKMIDCEACHQEISSASKTCPHCGHPNKLSQSKKISLYEWVVGIVMIAVIVLGFVLPSPIPGIPTCDASFSQKLAGKAFQRMRLAKIMDVTIVKMYNIETISNTPSERVCKASVILSNSQERHVQYNLTRKEDVISTELQVLD